ncbi:hypothetical protein DB35_13140 [Streptomyces abyssalis]|uniref:Uncharacterized protein n=1 Tax=Streptomyces abyssalis TaxID=933944 RepID=A0A1E7JGT9_9ACTN|nr:hypothetical protein AN215_24840 [Streptomyces abyssalis]OEU92856.1 hypothetical protein DB35_13140 [Streptomyces abyssalis]
MAGNLRQVMLYGPQLFQVTEKCVDIGKGCDAVGYQDLGILAGSLCLQWGIAVCPYALPVPQDLGRESRFTVGPNVRDEALKWLLVGYREMLAA